MDLIKNLNKMLILAMILIYKIYTLNKIQMSTFLYLKTSRIKARSQNTY